MIQIWGWVVYRCCSWPLFWMSSLPHMSVWISVDVVDRCLDSRWQLVWDDVYIIVIWCLLWIFVGFTRDEHVGWLVNWWSFNWWRQVALMCVWCTQFFWILRALGLLFGFAVLHSGFEYGFSMVCFVCFACCRVAILLHDGVMMWHSHSRVQVM